MAFDPLCGDGTAHAIREAIHVCFLFNVINRLSHAFGFDMPDDAGVRMIGRAAHRLGYSLTILPG